MIGCAQAAVALTRGQALNGAGIAPHVLTFAKEVSIAMFLTKLKTGAGLRVVAGIVTVMVGATLHPVGVAQDAKPTAAATSVPDISPEQFNRLRELIKPKPGGFDDIRWMTDLWAARQKAAREGKPLLVWVGDGHPLGWT
jgi:hypothetical protein